MRPQAAFARVPRPVWIGVATLAGLAVLIGGLLFYLHQRTIRNSRQSVTELVAQADHELSGGFYREAQPYLERAMRFARTRDSWLSIAKRAYRIARSTGNWEFLRRVADSGTNNLPGSQELWAVKTLAEERGGNPAAAEVTAREHLTDQRFESFGTEAVLRAHPNLKISGQTVSKRDRRLIDTLTSRNPNLFENLAQEIGSPDLLFDAILLYAWKGDMKAAYSMVVSDGNTTDPRAGMLISYDSGHYDSVRSYFDGMSPAQQTPDFRLLYDDVYVLQQEYDRAAKAYRSFIQAHPHASWTPYVNLAWIATDGKSTAVSAQQALALLQQGDKEFPQQRQVVLSLASLERSMGNEPAATTILSRFLKSQPWDLDANLLQMKLSGASQNAERVRSRLWELFYRADPGSKDRIAQYLAWYLLGISDYQGLDLIFRQLRGDTGTAWLPFFKGITDAIQGRYSQAIDAFAQSNQVQTQWETLYNLGVVELKAGDAKQSQQELQKADQQLMASDRSLAKSPERAAIHVALAEALAAAGDSNQAKRQVLYASDMDPGNLNAALLLKKLDSAVQK